MYFTFLFTLLYSLRIVLYWLLFVLPAAGRRDAGTSSSNNLASNGNYWSSTLTATGQSPFLNFNSSSASTSEGALAFASSVRCVQAFTEPLFFLTFATIKSGCILSSGGYGFWKCDM